MAMTRSITRQRRTKRHIYRSRVKTSPCRGQIRSACLEKYGCKNTKAGRRRSYCRKKMNRRA
jgi:hypothetical protein